ncbi:MAG: RNA 2',3'-cyclic phosphodiesterase [Planctomycetes bacterium]|nr:RNA 2',3'-cyclic phosphodiesterase [Planctomycetota bacterium]
MPTRTFLALDLDDAVLDSLEEARRRLVDGVDDKGIRWVVRENLHVTLAFAGSVNDEQLADICREVRPICQAIEPFDFQLKGVTCQPPGGHRCPRMIWANIEDPTGRLAMLQDSINGMMGSMGLRSEVREYLPHVTMARINSCRDAEGLRNRAKKLASMDLGVQHADEIVICASILAQTGAQYRPLARFPLGDA